MIILSAKQELVYNTLCELYGEDAVNFFTNIYGMQLCEDDDVYDALVDMGAIIEDEDEGEEWEDEWDN